ncbi:universal stress protein [Streptomyces sp. 549]|uniref:universal stress protein n=1 Tax=Streptomyces sp. 549 TaxID=3049076 RepID=UPI0024C46B92|nr:universal stress protein [Streptomyces sp. 549]MDK1472400.1 universal stress protein [Streptomyces sp. 549]
MSRPMNGPIVVGLDGSPESRAAADWAAGEASRREVPLLLLHSWTAQSLDLPIAQDGPNKQRWAQQLLHETEADLRSRHPKLDVSGELVAEQPVQALTDQGDSASLLVLGSRGYGAVAGFLMGSVSLPVLARATCPTVTVRLDKHLDKHRDKAVEATPPAAGAGPRDSGTEIVVGVHGTGRRDDASLAYAFSTADAQGLTVRAVHAWNPPPLLAYSQAMVPLANDTETFESEHRALLAESLAPWRQQYPDVPVVEHLDAGPAAPVLLAATAQARLLVVGRRLHRHPLAPKLGPVTHAALHHAPCPVAVIPHD